MSNIESKLFELIEMAENLKNDSSVEVIHFDYSSGTTLAELEYIEATYNLTLSKEIKEFYLNLNCFQLLWINKNNPDYDVNKHVYQAGGFDFEWPVKKELPFDGCINIWPIGDAFAYNWDEHITFEEEKEQSILIENTQYNLYDVKKRFIPFDLFSKDDCVGFYNSITTNTVDKIIYASDNYISFRDSKSHSMPQYLDLLIKSKGRINDRQMPFKGGRGFTFPLIN